MKNINLFSLLFSAILIMQHWQGMVHAISIKSKILVESGVSISPLEVLDGASDLASKLSEVGSKLKDFAEVVEKMNEVG